jgi:uncharacterized protein (UPF0332 family)
MQGKDFLAVAQKLCGSASEAERRTAVSRAYYAAYNHIKAQLESKKISIKKSADGHLQIYMYLNNSGVADARGIAGSLSSLRTIRDEADYDLNTSTFNPMTSTLQYELAVALLTDFDEINMADLREGIAKYKVATRDPS